MPSEPTKPCGSHDFLSRTRRCTGYGLRKQKQWQDLITAEIAMRLDGTDDVTARARARARAIVAAALTCADAAVDIWVERAGSGDLHTICKEMIE